MQSFFLRGLVSALVPLGNLARIPESNRNQELGLAIIVPLAGFKKIPMSAESKHEFCQQQLHDLEFAILEQKAGQSNRCIVKDLERTKKRLETKLILLAGEEKKGNTLTLATAASRAFS